MTASHEAELEALLVRLDEMRRLLEAMAKDRSQMKEGISVTDDLQGAQQALTQAEKLLRRARDTLERS